MWITSMRTHRTLRDIALNFFWIKTKPAAAAVDAFIVLLKLNLNSTQLLLNDFVRVPNPNRALCVYAYVETMETLIITYC